MVEAQGSKGGTSATLSRLDQLRALANDVRIRMVALLRERAWTMAELGDELGLRKGSVSFHLHVLEKSGLAAMTDTRAVRGGRQQRWVATAAQFDIALGADDSIGRPALVRVLADQIGRGTDPRLLVSHVRLDSDGRARAVAILEGALAQIKELRTDAGTVTTIAALSFGTEQSQSS